MNFFNYFFGSEYCCRDDDSQRQPRQRQEPSAFTERCAVCGRQLVFGRDSSVVTCPGCDTDYAPDWNKLR